jgi:hypothetical protein
MVELLRNILAKRVAGTSWGNAPTAAVIRIRPQEIADRSLMRNFLNSVELSDLIKSVNGRRETTMETEDLALDNSSQWKIIEEFSKSFPHIGISILSQTLIVEAVPIEAD